MYLTSQELADRFKLNPRHVVNVITKQDGFPQAYKFGNALRWELSEVVKWEDKQRVSRAARSANLI